MGGGATVLVGTIGQGVMRGPDHGESWQRSGPDQGMHSDALVRCLANHPKQPNVVFPAPTAACSAAKTPVGRGGGWSRH